MRPPIRVSRRMALGFSLIELLIAMAIALVTTIAVAVVLVNADRSKRTTTSANDLNQNAAYITYLMDRHVRSAGSGFGQRWDDVGCKLSIWRNGAAIIPAATLSDPFAKAQKSSQHLAPVLIEADAADTDTEVRGDVVTVMAGTSGVSGAIPQVLLKSMTGDTQKAQVQVPTTLGVTAGDLVLVSDQDSRTCGVEQVTGTGTDATTLAFSGEYFQPVFFSGSPYVMPIGSMDGPPQFSMYGVGDDATLFSMDLFQFNDISEPQPLAEGVVEMRAIYGLDTNDDGKLDSWAKPDSDEMGPDKLLVPAKLRKVIAIRLAFVLRTGLREKEMPVAANPDGTPYTLRMFEDLKQEGHDVSRTRVISGDDLYHRFRVVETTVPLRNVMLAPSS